MCILMCVVRLYWHLVAFGCGISGACSLRDRCFLAWSAKSSGVRKLDCCIERLEEQCLVNFA